jgi:cytochrome c-type biogenesis protein CcmE
MQSNGELAQVPIRGAKLVFTTLVSVAAAGGYHHLATSRVGSKYHFVDTLVAEGLRANAGRELKIHGFVRPGSVTETAGMHTFELTYRGAGLRVTATNPPPEVIRDHADVIVTGRLVEHDGWTLTGSVVVAKCGGYRERNADLNESKFQ